MAVKLGFSTGKGFLKEVDEAKNAKKVNDLEIKRDTNGVLKIGNTIIPQKKLLWEGTWSISPSSSSSTTGNSIALPERVTENDVLEIEYSTNPFEADNAEIEHIIARFKKSSSFGNIVLYTISDYYDSNSHTVVVTKDNFMVNNLSSGGASMTYIGGSRIIVTGSHSTSQSTETTIYKIYKVIE